MIDVHTRRVGHHCSPELGGSLPVAGSGDGLSINCRRLRPTLADIGGCRFAWPHVLYGDDEVKAIG